MSNILSEFRNKVYLGDCIEVLKEMPSGSVSACLTDPPYGLSSIPDAREVLRHWLAGGDFEHKGGGFMGKSWDSFVPGPKVWEEVMRVLKPGGHVFSFGGTRTYDLMVMAMRIAGCEVRDKLDFLCELEDSFDWTYGCLSDDTELLIDGRWEPYHKAIEGKHTLCYSVDKDELRWEPIQEVFVYEYDDIAYRIQSDSTDQIVSRNHRCIIERDGKKEFRVAEELAAGGQQVCVPVVENMRSVFESFRLYTGESEKNKENMFESLWDKTGCSKETGETTVGEGRKDGGGVRGVRQEGLEVQGLDKEGKDSNVFSAMQRSTEGEGLGETWIQGQGGMDTGERGELSSQDDGCKQSCLEGRGDVFQDARELQGGEVCQVSGGAERDGSKGRVCNGASSDCCSCDGEVVIEEGGCASCESRPDGQSVGKSGVICEQSGTQGIRGREYITTTMARVEPFRYVGKVWCVRVPTGAFVARRNGKVFVTGNSGFPKSANVSKMMDKAGGAASKEWDGYGTALKPAHEPVAMFVKSGGDGNQVVGTPFMYTAKVSRKERNLGCGHLFWVEDGDAMRLVEEAEYKALEEENAKRKDEAGFEAHRLAQGNPHPTVKPIELMRYLVRMVKMPGDNLVLDPFCGSGSTLCGCALEGCDFVGIDSDPMAATLAATRAHYFQCLGEKGLK